VNPPASTSFSFEWVFLVLSAAAVYGYVRVARVERPSRARMLLFGLGIALLALPLNSPLETIAVHYLLVIHLLQNVMIADWAPPLLILGLTPGMRASVARRGGRPLALVTRPAFALPIWLVGWYAIHAALFYDFALRHAWTLNIEHLLLLVIGLVFWWPILSSEPVDLGAPLKIGYLGAAFVGSVFLGLGLTFSSTPLYDFYAHAPRLWGLSAEKDQNFGGILMNVEQAFVFLAAILYFVARLIPEDERSRADV
jgi:cytochrome c oxidase assembly factor CtaG